MHSSRRVFLGAVTAASYQRLLGANDRVQVGFIGYGLIGRQHVHDFKNQKDADLAAMCEVCQPRLEEGIAACGPGAKPYQDFRKLLDNKDIQAIVVCTPDHWHALLAIMACAAGKDVYVEKPLTLFVKEGRWMTQAARRYQRIVQVGTQQRSGPHYQHARQLTRDAYFGKVLSARMGSFRNVMPGFGNPPDGPPPRDLDYDMWLGPAPQRPYNPHRALYHFRWFWDYSGGQMTNLAAHPLDVVHWYLDLQGPSAVTSAGGRLCLEDNGETPDTQDVLIEYPGFTALWSLREACAGPTPAVLEFCGSKGTLTVSRSGFVLTGDRKIPPENAVPQFAGAHPVGGPQRVVPTKPGELWVRSIEDKTGDAREQLRLHVRHFLDCIKTRQVPVSDLESGHRVATVCHLANLSLKLGRRLRWDCQREVVIDDAEANKLLVRTYRSPWDKELKGLGVG